MPFLDDSGARPEEEHGPVGRAFALLRDQLERLILLNLAWIAQIVPLLVAWVVPTLPPALRLALTLYSAVALLPATVVVWAVLREVGEGQPLSLELVWDALKAQWRRGFLALLPLVSLFYWLALAAGWAAERQLLFLDVLARLVILVLALLSLYWGPVMVADDRWAGAILFRSAQLVWRRPLETLGIGAACLAAAVLGVVSIGGLFLVAPVLVALLQTELYRSVQPRPALAR